MSLCIQENALQLLFWMKSYQFIFIIQDNHQWRTWAEGEFWSFLFLVSADVAIFTTSFDKNKSSCL